MTRRKKYLLPYGVWLRLLYETTLIETVMNNLQNFAPLTRKERLLKIMLRSRIIRNSVHRLKKAVMQEDFRAFYGKSHF